MRRLSIVLGVALATLAAGGAAVAVGAVRAPTLAITTEGTNGAAGAVVSGASWRVSGVLSTYLPRQFVSVHVFEGGRRIEKVRVPVLRRPGGGGAFSMALRVGGVGRVTVHAVHFRSPALGRIASNFLSVWVVAPTVAPGAQTLATRILQSQLEALHYVVGAPGVDDSQTQLATLAFQKMTGLPLTGVADPAVFAALAAGKGAFPVRFPSHGRHVEADLTHQVLALIGAGGRVEALYTMSSGKPSTPTAPGSFTTYLKTPGVNSEGMVDSSYFNGGDAIHGYPEVPPYAASHGCLRVPIPDAPAIYAWVTLGTPVDVYFS
jgi:hypothetical protein